MSIFDKYKGADEAGSFEVGSDFPVIPKGTSVLAACESASNEVYKEDEFVTLKWRVVKPAEYENFVIFQKVRILSLIHI